MIYVYCIHPSVKWIELFFTVVSMVAQYIFLVKGKLELLLSIASTYKRWNFQWEKNTQTNQSTTKKTEILGFMSAIKWVRSFQKLDAAFFFRRNINATEFNVNTILFFWQMHNHQPSSYTQWNMYICVYWMLQAIFVRWYSCGYRILDN